MVEHGSRLLLEPASGRPMGAVDLKPPSQLTTVLAAADGTWTVRDVEAIVRHRKAHCSVADADGVEVAAVWFEGARARIELRSGQLVWEAPSLRRLRWNYRIEGLFVARVRPLYYSSRAPRSVRRPFAVEVSLALAARPDASLVLLLGAWLTRQDSASIA